MSESAIEKIGKAVFEQRLTDPSAPSPFLRLLEAVREIVDMDWRPQSARQMSVLLELRAAYEPFRNDD